MPKYNRPAIDDAITSGKQLRFSYNPRKYLDCALEWEWNYIKNILQKLRRDGVIEPHGKEWILCKNKMSKNF